MKLSTWGTIGTLACYVLAMASAFKGWHTDAVLWFILAQLRTVGTPYDR